MNNQNNNNTNKEKAFFLNLKKRVSQNGKSYYTGKFAYAIDIIAFEKKDNSGDLTVWLQPKDMDQMKQNQDGKGNYQQQQKPIPQGRPYVAPSQAPQQNEAPWPDEPEIPF